MAVWATSIATGAILAVATTTVAAKTPIEEQKHHERKQPPVDEEPAATIDDINYMFPECRETLDTESMI